LKVVIKLGGAVFSPAPNIDLIKAYNSIFRKIHKEGHRVVVVTGGGARARDYIKMARDLGTDEGVCDQIGIEVSRLNATLMMSSLGEAAYPIVPRDMSEARRALHCQKVLFMGGVTPGQSTDAVAALMAEMVGADVFVRTLDVDGVYTDDPKRNKKAKRIESITVEELAKLLVGGGILAGTYPLLDPIALKIIERSKVQTWFVNGRDPENLRKLFKGAPVGTKIRL